MSMRAFDQILNEIESAFPHERLALTRALEVSTTFAGCTALRRLWSSEEVGSQGVAAESMEVVESEAVLALALLMFYLANDLPRSQVMSLRYAVEILKDPLSASASQDPALGGRTRQQDSLAFCAVRMAERLGRPETRLAVAVAFDFLFDHFTREISGEWHPQTLADYVPFRRVINGAEWFMRIELALLGMPNQVLNKSVVNAIEDVTYLSNDVRSRERDRSQRRPNVFDFISQEREALALLHSAYDVLDEAIVDSQTSPVLAEMITQTAVGPLCAYFRMEQAGVVRYEWEESGFRGEFRASEQHRALALSRASGNQFCCAILDRDPPRV